MLWKSVAYAVPSKLVALVVAAIVARVTNQVGFVIASGMAAYWLLTLAR